ncbi:hypothetical protein C8R46DRAFT_1354061 [Mycena filopes]|nr:hypothetical protein C8R46DRAFT_1354061 [Mycena filopes]
MDFVPSSQSHQDLEDNVWDFDNLPNLSLATPSPDSEPCFDDSTTTSASSADWDEYVASSQPFEDGEEDLLPMGPSPTPPVPLRALEAPGTPSNTNAASSPLAHRGRLVRRASPVKPRAPHASTVPSSRPVRLIRRVTFAADLDRRRKRARIEARQIFKKIQALAPTLRRLQRRHRESRSFGAGSSVGNKENTMSPSSSYRLQ